MKTVIKKTFTIADKKTMRVAQQETTALVEGLQGKPVLHDVTTFFIEKQGTLHHVYSPEPSNEATKPRTVIVNANASYELHYVAIGSLSSEHQLTVRLCGDNAQVTIFSLTALDGTAVNKECIHIIHEAANAASSVTQRTLARDQSSSAFTGTVTISPEGKKADAGLSSRGLLLSPVAHISSKPEFEILTDDVGCKHGATIGELDDEALFYLRSRGLSEPQAKQVLLTAFTEDVINTIAPVALQKTIKQKMAAFIKNVYAK